MGIPKRNRRCILMKGIHKTEAPAQLHHLLKAAVGPEAERRRGRAERATGVRTECPSWPSVPMGKSLGQG